MVAASIKQTAKEAKAGSVIARETDLLRTTRVEVTNRATTKREFRL
jgi:hypothetical protein